jgi:carbon monoxide dehydrogenase subunit G
MNFNIGGVLPATATQLWAIFFDVRQVAGLIPGCEDVVEVEPLKEFSAVMKQKVGPFKLEVPTRILVESHTPERQVSLRATGRDKRTATTIDVQMNVDLDDRGAGQGCRLDIDAQMQVAGRMASLGYPIIKKKSEELFAEFESRLRQKLSDVGGSDDGRLSQPDSPVGAAAPQADAPDGTQPTTQRADHFSRRLRHGADASQRAPGGAFVLPWPRAGLNAAAGLVVACVAVALGQSYWWWLAAPLLGVAATVGRRGN